MWFERVLLPLHPVDVPILLLPCPGQDFRMLIPVRNQLLCVLLAFVERNWRTNMSDCIQEDRWMDLLTEMGTVEF